MLNIETATHEELCDVINSDIDLIDWWIQRDLEIPESMATDDVRRYLTQWVEEGDECFIL